MNRYMLTITIVAVGASCLGIGLFLEQRQVLIDSQGSTELEDSGNQKFQIEVDKQLSIGAGYLILEDNLGKSWRKLVETRLRRARALTLRR
ncbi:hypothetical protein R1sor_009749 [Riccia sorocarpa]|uniref:Uncharacterized protein n=1 Tax=Riccia sorocarpa TaxID=122646 RepID=A0ABD3HW01_9MARC